MEVINLSLQDKYLSLEKKEQRYLQVCVVTIVLFIIYQFIYEPYQASMTKMEQRLSYQLKLNNWFKSVDVKLKKLHHQTDKLELSKTKLLSTTSTSLKRSSLKSNVYELQQSDDGVIQLILKSAPYVEFINWLEDFSRHYQINIKELNLTHLNKPGLVSINLRFEVK